MLLHLDFMFLSFFIFKQVVQTNSVSKRAKMKQINFRVRSAKITNKTETTLF